MTRKKRRLYLLTAGMLALATATALVLAAFEENLVFFYSPSDLAAQQVTPEQRLRIGGLVEEGSIHLSGETVRFNVTDMAHVIPVTYTGILPDLFREGQGVVAEGRLGPEGVFAAQSVLARHDENYMPREVEEALRKAGHWKPDEDTP